MDSWRSTVDVPHVPIPRVRFPRGMAPCFASPAAKLVLRPRTASWGRGTTRGPGVPFRPIGGATGEPSLPQASDSLSCPSAQQGVRLTLGGRPQGPGCSCGGIGTRPTGPLPWAACVRPFPSVQLLRRWRPRSVGLALPTACAASTRLRMPSPRGRASSSTPHRSGTFAATREASTCTGSHAVIMGVRSAGGGAAPTPRRTSRSGRPPKLTCTRAAKQGV